MVAQPAVAIVKACNPVSSPKRCLIVVVQKVLHHLNLNCFLAKKLPRRFKENKRAIMKMIYCVKRNLKKKRQEFGAFERFG